MSASLVGSEMCIRDSRKVPPGGRVGEPGEAQGRGYVRLRELRGVVGGAVSYTHLTLPTICSV
eukprot:4910314-Alexandrium_andersonii.AAC.1